MHNSRKKFIYRSPNEGLEEGSYKSKSTLKDGAGRTITFAITYRGRVFYQNWLKGKKKRWELECVISQGNDPNNKTQNRRVVSICSWHANQVAAG